MVRHRPPGVVGRRGFGVPHVTCVPGEVSLFEDLDECVALHDRAARCVDQPSALFHTKERVAVEEALRLRRQGSFDDDDVAVRQHVVEARVPEAADLFFYVRETAALVVVH